jgi:hypothetical protein
MRTLIGHEYEVRVQLIEGERRVSASERSGVGSSPLLGPDWRTQ